MVDGAVTLLDQEAFDATAAEIGGKREADRPAADDEDRRLVAAAHAGFSTAADGSTRRWCAGYR